MKSFDELPERFRSKIRVNEETGCWEWAGALSCAGYGITYVLGKRRVAHRVVYELLVSEIKDPLQCDHLCRNRKCCNPKHTEPVTRKENILRGESPQAWWARQKVCPKCGAPFSQYRDRRYCPPCKRKRAADRSRERYASDPNFRAKNVEKSRQYRARKLNGTTA